MQYLNTSITSQVKAVILGTEFSSQSYHHAWDILYEKYGRSDTHPAILHDNSTSIVKLANVVTNLANTWTQIGYTSDRKGEAGLSSTNERTVVPIYARALTTERKLV